MRQRIKHVVVTLLIAVVVLAAAGAIIAALAGRDTWRTIAWTFLIGGGIIVVVNVAGSGSDRPVADPHTGFALRLSAPDAATSASWLLVGVVLVGLGALGLFA
jgi:hypothetical protein